MLPRDKGTNGSVSCEFNFISFCNCLIHLAYFMRTKSRKTTTFEKHAVALDMLISTYG
jgi:hypothetical protein